MPLWRSGFFMQACGAGGNIPHPGKACGAGDDFLPSNRLVGQAMAFPFPGQACGQAATFPIRGRLVGQAMAFPLPGQAEGFLQFTGHRRTFLTPLRSGAMWQVRQFCPTCHITPLHKTTEEGHVWPVKCRNYITHKIQQFKYLHYKKKDLTLLAEQP